MRQPVHQDPGPKYKIYQKDGKEYVYERHVVHRFSMGDVEDPDIYIAQPIWDWQQTDHGKWIMEHAKDPTYHIFPDPVSFGYAVTITAHVEPKRWTEYVLRGWYTG